MLSSRLTEADPLASYRAEQCVLHISPFETTVLDSISGPTQKNSFCYFIAIVLDIDVYYSTLSDLPDP